MRNIALLSFLIIFFFSCTNQSAIQEKKYEGRKLYKKKCFACHDLYLNLAASPLSLSVKNSNSFIKKYREEKNYHDHKISDEQLKLIIFFVENDIQNRDY